MSKEKVVMNKVHDLVRKERKQKEKEVEMYGEICYCGHLKTCHYPHQLDIHGGNCSHCDCKIYTWKDFVFKNKEKK